MNLDELHERFGEHLYLPDPGVVDFTAAVVLANRLRNDPVWGLVVGPPGAGKTETVISTFDLPQVYPLSKLTKSTLISGKPKPKDGREPSLLLRLEEMGKSMLVLKDFTTVLQMHHEDRAEVLSQLREVYDGQLDNDYGNGVSIHWKGHLGFLAGVTPVIDIHHAALSILGERFIYYRLPKVDRPMLSEAALDMNDEDAVRRTLREAITGFLHEVIGRQVEFTPSVRSQIISVANIATWARSAVARDPYGSREILTAPSEEAPTRMAKQLRSLWVALTAMGHEDPMALVSRVAQDSMPRERLLTLLLLYRGTATSTEIRKHLRLPYTTGERIREDLEALDLIEIVQSGGEGRPHTYALTPEARSALDAAGDAFRTPPVTALPRGGKERYTEEPRNRVGSVEGNGHGFATLAKEARKTEVHA